MADIPEGFLVSPNSRIPRYEQRIRLRSRHHQCWDRRTITPTSERQPSYLEGENHLVQHTDNYAYLRHQRPAPHTSQAGGAAPTQVRQPSRRMDPDSLHSRHDYRKEPASSETLYAVTSGIPLSIFGGATDASDTTDLLIASHTRSDSWSARLPSLHSASTPTRHSPSHRNLPEAGDRTRSIHRPVLGL